MIDLRLVTNYLDSIPTLTTNLTGFEIHPISSGLML